MSKEISIIITTYNRAEYLRGTLASLLPVIAGRKDRVEIIVVDNNSTDHTAEVVRSLKESHPEYDLERIEEKQQGLSHARNRGLREASGKTICFLDDDVYVTDNWLAGIMAAFALDENVGAVGGRIELLWEAKHDMPWLEPRYLGFFSCYDQGEHSKVLNAGQDFVGANFALSRRVVESVGLFDVNLGRKKNNLLGGEETDYSRRIWRNGFKIAYSAEGLVRHRVPPERCSFRWLRRRSFWQGVSSYYKPKNRMFLFPLVRLPKLIASLLLLIFSTIFYQKKYIYRALLRLADSFGPFYGLYLDIIGRKA